MSWLDANDYVVMEVAARDRMDSVRSTMDRVLATAYRLGSAATKLPLISVSPFWLAAWTSPSMRPSPPSSNLRVTLPVHTTSSPG